MGSVRNIKAKQSRILHEVAQIEILGGRQLPKTSLCRVVKLAGYNNRKRKIDNHSFQHF